ncbi:unnamed protein product, partial [Prorocentrum cordatum]
LEAFLLARLIRSGLARIAGAITLRAPTIMPQCYGGPAHAASCRPRAGRGAALHIRDVPKRAEACARVVVDHVLQNRTEAAASHLDAEVAKLARTSYKAFYHSLIHACGLLGSSRTAVWCSVQMVRMGMKPNIVTFNSLIDACAKTRNLPLAIEVWGIMSDEQVAPNHITYNTMINACSQACDAQKAVEWLQRMQDDNFSPDTVTYGAIFSVCAKTADVDAAEVWFQRMDQSGAKADRVIFNPGRGGGFRDRRVRQGRAAGRGREVGQDDGGE